LQIRTASDKGRNMALGTPAMKSEGTKTASMPVADQELWQCNFFTSIEALLPWAPRSLLVVMNVFTGYGCFVHQKIPTARASPPQRHDVDCLISEIKNTTDETSANGIVRDND